MESPDADSSPGICRDNWAVRVLRELGLVTLFTAPTDTKLLVVQRFVRLFAYGASTLILVAYLSALGNSDRRIGAFMTATLIGDVCISLVLTLFADRLGRRAILMLGAFLMSASGVSFALSGDYYVLLLAAILGVISPSGNEIGPFRAIEESTLAHLTQAEARSDIYAWYSLVGNAGSASGMLICGWAVYKLQASQWDEITAYRIVFYGYAVAGLVKFLLAFALSRAIEKEAKQAAVQAPETAPLLRSQQEDSPKSSWWKKVLPPLSAEGRKTAIQLCTLFALDSFASGLASLSWVTYFFKWKFGLDEGKLGTLFSIASIISAASVLVASSVSKKLGNVKTMVFTHLPSAVALALIAVPPSPLPSMALLLLRACTQSMDVAPRSAFLAEIIRPEERTALMGIINMVKTASQSFGPLVTGALAGQRLFWVAFVMAGSLKATYDIGFLLVFAERKSGETEHGD